MHIRNSWNGEAKDVRLPHNCSGGKRKKPLRGGKKGGRNVVATGKKPNTNQDSVYIRQTAVQGLTCKLFTKVPDIHSWKKCWPNKSLQLCAKHRDHIFFTANIKIKKKSKRAEDQILYRRIFARSVFVRAVFDCMYKLTKRLTVILTKSGLDDKQMTKIEQKQHLRRILPTTISDP